MTIRILHEGGLGSGNHGHDGRPGQVGGSAGGGGTKPTPSPNAATDKDANLDNFAQAIMALSPQHFEPGANPKQVRSAYHFDTTLADKISTGIAKDGGITISVQGEIPSHGFVIGGAGHEEVLDVPVGPKQIDNYINHNLGALTLRDHYFGAWVDSSKVYLDVSTIRSDKSAALDEARTRDQIAIWSLDAGTGYNTMSDGARPSESKGDPIKEAQSKSVGPKLMLFGHNLTTQEIADAINAEAKQQVSLGQSRKIIIRPKVDRG